MKLEHKNYTDQEIRSLCGGILKDVHINIDKIVYRALHGRIHTRIRFYTEEQACKWVLENAHTIYCLISFPDGVLAEVFEYTDTEKANHRSIKENVDIENRSEAIGISELF